MLAFGSHDFSRVFFRNKIFIASVFVLACVVLTTYHPALALNFYGDDYSFVETAGRSTLGQYLAFYFDPRLQTGWYRPMQGMLFGIEWLLFGGNPLGYHVVNALVHLANALLLFAILSRISRFSRLAFLAALIWLGLPLFGVAVFWPGDADFLLTFFYLAAIYFWILFLQEERKKSNHLKTSGDGSHAIETLAPNASAGVLGVGAQPAIEIGSNQTVEGRSRPNPTGINALLRKNPNGRRWQIYSFIAFLFALLTKEFGATIPVTLFLIDCFILRDRITPRTLIARYLPFLIVYAIYLPLELYIQSRSVLTNEFGYGIGAQIPQNFFAYLAALAFPWLLPEPINFIWLALAAILLISLSLIRKTLTPIILILIAIIAFVPVTPFPWFFYRYLYSATMISAIFFAWLVIALLKKFQARWVALAASVALAIVIFGNGLGVAAAAADFAEIGRQTRVPFRDFTQRHSALPADTLIYFINPPTITSQLSGMFFLRYGASVRVASDDQPIRANLREHQAAYVIYFDEQKRTREIQVENNISAKSDSPLPQKLADWELASDHAKRGDAIVLLLYWDAPTDASVMLVENATGQAIAVSSGRTRGTVADARVLAIPLESRPGIYRVEIMAAGQKISIAPIVVSE